MPRLSGELAQECAQAACVPPGMDEPRTSQRGSASAAPGRRRDRGPSDGPPEQAQRRCPAHNPRCAPGGRKTHWASRSGRSVAPRPTDRAHQRCGDETFANAPGRRRQEADDRSERRGRCEPCPPPPASAPADRGSPGCCAGHRCLDRHRDPSPSGFSNYRLAVAARRSRTCSRLSSSNCSSSISPATHRAARASWEGLGSSPSARNKPSASAAACLRLSVATLGAFWLAARSRA
jgi:hypothetical protein